MDSASAVYRPCSSADRQMSPLRRPVVHGAAGAGDGAGESGRGPGQWGAVSGQQRTRAEMKPASIIARFGKVNVLVAGDLMLDQFIWGRVERISPEAPVPVVHMTSE